MGYKFRRQIPSLVNASVTSLSSADPHTKLLTPALYNFYNVFSVCTYSVLHCRIASWTLTTNISVTCKQTEGRNKQNYDIDITIDIIFIIIIISISAAIIIIINIECTNPAPMVAQDEKEGHPLGATAITCQIQSFERKRRLSPGEGVRNEKRIIIYFFIIIIIITICALTVSITID